MRETVEFDGCTFYRYTGRRYFEDGTRLLHRAVYEKAHGKIPRGYEVHHKDFDPGNNALENLELLTPRQHGLLHRKPVTCKGCGKIFYGSRQHQLYCSKECERIVVCKACGKSFGTRSHSVFCTNACKSRWRRQERIDNVSKRCGYCGKMFSRNRYDEQRFCSAKCGSRSRFA